MRRNSKNYKLLCSLQTNDWVQYEKLEGTTRTNVARIAINVFYHTLKRNFMHAFEECAAMSDMVTSENAKKAAKFVEVYISLL